MIREYNFPVRSLSWIVSGIERVMFQENSKKNTGLSQKQGMNIFKYP